MRIRLEKTRLSGAKDFDPVFAGEKFVAGCLVFYFTSSAHESGRVGIVVGKKVLPGAVDRNRFKRRIRALYREHLDRLKGFDIVVLARKGKLLESFHFLSACFEKFTRRLEG